MPLFINILIFSLLIYFGLGQVESLMNTLLPASDAWWAQALRFVFLVVFWLVAALILFFGFTLVANLLAAPFNGLLAERVEIHLTGASSAGAPGFLSALRDIGPAMMSELQKYGYFLVVALILLVLFVIPGVNFFSPLFTAIFSAWMLALEYTAYPAENSGIKFKAARGTARGQRMMALGFGGAVMLATMIPLVNFLVMPAAVAGATALWVEHWRAS